MEFRKGRTCFIGIFSISGNIRTIQNLHYIYIFWRTPCSCERPRSAGNTAAHGDERAPSRQVGAKWGEGFKDGTFVRGIFSPSYAIMSHCVNISLSVMCLTKNFLIVLRDLMVSVSLGTSNTRLEQRPLP